MFNCAYYPALIVLPICSLTDTFLCVSSCSKRLHKDSSFAKHIRKDPRVGYSSFPEVEIPYEPSILFGAHRSIRLDKH